uniref:Transposase n=1 Tax=Steinernema glaseri TaxID=37863 RepID=A0A1I7YIZ4_9BILA
MRSSERRSMLPVQQTVVADCHRSLALLYHPGEKGREGPPPNKCPKLFSVDRAAVQRRTLCLQEGAAMQNNQVQLIFAAAVDSPPDLEPDLFVKLKDGFVALSRRFQKGRDGDWVPKRRTSNIRWNSRKQELGYPIRRPWPRARRLMRLPESTVKTRNGDSWGREGKHGGCGDNERRPHPSRARKPAPPDDDRRPQYGESAWGRIAGRRPLRRVIQPRWRECAAIAWPRCAARDHRSTPNRYSTRPIARAHRDYLRDALRRT